MKEWKERPDRNGEENGEEWKESQKGIERRKGRGKLRERKGSVLAGNQ